MSLFIKHRFSERTMITIPLHCLEEKNSLFIQCFRIRQMRTVNYISLTFNSDKLQLNFVYTDELSTLKCINAN